MRAAVASDATFVQSLAQRTFLKYGSYERYLDDWFHHEDVETFVAEIDGRPSGFVMMTTYVDAEGSGVRVADVVAIAVSPEHQSHGVGTRLLDKVIEVAAASDPPVAEVWLVVAETNARARRFFARRGFRSGTGVGVYPAGQRALRMVKSLSAVDGR